MKIITPEWISRTPRRASAVCLCLLLAGWWHAVPRRAIGQERPVGAASQSAELEEAARLSELVLKLYGDGRYTEALPMAERALAIREKALGPDHPDVTAARANLAVLHFGSGDLKQAEPLLQRVLSTDEKRYGPEHPNIVSSLNNLATLYEAKGDHAQAESLFQRALVIAEKADGPEHQSLIVPLNNLAALYHETGDLTRAESLYLRMLHIVEKARTPDQPDLIVLLNNLAALYDTKGDYARAETILKRALKIGEKVHGPDHPEVAKSLHRLATLYRNLGDYTQAKALYQRALNIDEKAYGPDHPAVASSLHNLASLYKDTGELEQAVHLFDRALRIKKQVYGSDHLEVADTLNNMAELVRLSGDSAEAETLYLRALDITEKALGPNHLSVAKSLSNLAGLYVEKGDYARAEPLYLRALNIGEKGLGPDHPVVATLLNNLGALYEAKGDHPRAIQVLLRFNEMEERNLSLILATGSERRKLAYVAALSGETDSTISLHTRSAPSDAQALRLSLTTILRRKGRTLDAMTEQVAGLRRRLDPQDRALLDQLGAAQSQLSNLVLSSPGGMSPEIHRVTVSRLEEIVEQLQDAASRRGAEFKAQAQPVTIERVRQALPDGAALVEFFSYQPFNPKARLGAATRFGPARYVAYVLQKEGDPTWADIGEASAVDADITRLLIALRCPQTVDDVRECPAGPEVKRLARAVDERVMRPVRKLLGATRHIFISSDGTLNLLPFAALADENDKYLVENYLLTYLTSGRDLLRLQSGSRIKESPLIVADPAFNKIGQMKAAARNSEPTQSKRSADMVAANFSSLPGTAAEARAVAAVLPGARVYTQASATEEIIKQADGPLILHIATHGFFLSDQLKGLVDGVRSFGIGFDDAPVGLRMLARSENPLLRSGLALAGANLQPPASGEDGILTALETAGLNLWGTRLVVLSACETGVGKVQNGEGVYGLRRALVLAGSESQMMSLWQVSDAATRHLMASYYKHLVAGEGRTAALRQVQLEMLRGGRQVGDSQASQLSAAAKVKADYSHPYYWAAFIQSGDWRRMNF